jgi:hypothetical protein
VQFPEIAVIQEPPDHVRRNLVCALLVKPVPGRELKTAIGAGRRNKSDARPPALRRGSLKPL